MTMILDLEPTDSLTFQQALDMAEVLARNALPTVLHERLSCAVALVKAGAVLETDTPHTWEVVSARTPGKAHSVNGACRCEDAHYRAPQGRCKHVLAVLLARKTLKLIEEPPQETPAPTQPAQPAAVPEPVPGIPAQHVVLIQGKPFVKFAGLLQMAHDRGLTSLTADWTYNDAELSLAHAVATFQDGRRFEESGDAAPANVTKKVALHFRRVALTRAKARVLRDALNVDLVAVEEFADEEGARAAPPAPQRDLGHTDTPKEQYAIHDVYHRA